MSLEELIDGNDECPLCMEPLELDDINFFPCTCGYQICRFCWHRIRTDENGLCPACRKAYPEDPAEFKPLTEDELQRIKKERRQKDLQRKQKAAENRKHLANVRVVQRNLVFVVGLSQRLADPEVLKKHEYFGKFGKTMKVVINQSTSYAGAQVGGPSASAYITYLKSEDALRAIQAVNNIHVDGRTLKASLGTTKYCSHFLRGTQCPKPDCMYLHELGEEAASFTKEEMQQGKHQEYEQALYESFMNSQNLANTGATNTAPPPPAPSLTPPVVAPQNNAHQKNHRKKTGSPSTTGGHSPQSGNSSSSNTPPPPPPSLLTAPTQPPHQQHTNNHDTSASAWPSLQPAAKPLTNGTSSAPGGMGKSSSCERPDSSSSPASTSSSSSTPDMVAAALSRAPGHHRQQQQQTATSEQLQRQQQTHSPHMASSSSIPNSNSTVSTELSASNGLPSSSSASNGSGQRSTPPGLVPPSSSSSSIPPLLPPHLLKARPAAVFPVVDSAADSMSLFSMSGGFTGNSRNLAAAAAAAEAAAAATSKQTTMPPSEDIPESLPVNSTTDWQAAFGFGAAGLLPRQQQQQQQQPQQPPQIQHADLVASIIDSAAAAASQADDDLGFDPWMESSKALAELVEKEGNLQHQQHQQQHMSLSTSPQMNNLPPGFTPNHIGAAFSAPPNPYLSLGSHNHHQHHHPQHQQHQQQQQQQQAPSPPLGAAAAANKHDHHMAGGGHKQLHNSMQKHAAHFEHGGGGGGGVVLQDWQEGLRALLPNINISFGQPPSQQLPHHSKLLPDHTPQQQQNHTFNRTPSWDLSYDPAIVTSGHVECGSAAGEAEPHWMASLQSLTEDPVTTNHRLPFVQQFHGSTPYSSSSLSSGGGAAAAAAASTPWSTRVTSTTAATAPPPPGFHNNHMMAPPPPHHLHHLHHPEPATTATSSPDSLHNSHPPL